MKPLADTIIENQTINEGIPSKFLITIEKLSKEIASASAVGKVQIDGREMAQMLVALVSGFPIEKRLELLNSGMNLIKK